MLRQETFIGVDAYIPNVRAVRGQSKGTAIATRARRSVGPELESSALREAVSVATRVAAVPGMPVLVQGEMGTPTGELARLIHERSEGKRGGIFVAVRSQGVPEQILEAELFGDGETNGHTPGAFQRAIGGSIFIDQVSDLGPSAQVKLVAFLAETETCPPRLRVIAATDRSLGAAARAKTFRRELLECLDVVTIEVPPLRDRREDVERLAVVYAQRVRRTISREAILALQRYAFPGNERELRAIIVRAAVLETGAAIEPVSIVFSNASAPLEEVIVERLVAESGGRLPKLADVERAYVAWMLKHTAGNRTAAARLLGVSYPTIAKKLADYNIDAAAFASTRRESK